MSQSLARKFIYTFFVLLFAIVHSVAQQSLQPKSKVFVTAGYGLAGSFFVRSYDEFSGPDGWKGWSKKHFIGNAQNIAVGIHLKHNIDISVGFHYQRFNRHVKFNDTLSGVAIVNDHTIYDKNNIWFGGISKSYLHKKQLFSFGIGLYYLRPQQESIDVIQPGLYIDREYNQKNNGLNELGVFGELDYEYEFQPKVSIGVKGQIYYTASASYFESVTLYPYIKFNF